MAVIITPSTPEGGTLPLLKKITIPGHGHLSRSQEGFFVDVCNVPPGITHYEVDLLQSDLVPVDADGYCRICKGTCPCGDNDDKTPAAQDWPSLRDELAFTEAEEAEIATEMNALQARQDTHHH